jgi:hypothetical protein
MDVLKNYIICEGGNPSVCCDLCHMQWNSSEQGKIRVDFVFQDFSGYGRGGVRQ